MPNRRRPSHRSGRQVVTRARYTRTNADLLTAGSYSTGPGVDPSGQPPAMWWTGVDDGGGAFPIGPNGPWPDGFAAALPVVTRATALITGPLTAAPFRVQELGFAGKPLGRPTWVTDPCLTRPDGRIRAPGQTSDAPIIDFLPDVAKLTRGNFWASWIRDACHAGSGAFLVQEDASGAPRAGTLQLVNPYLLSAERAGDGQLRWVIGADGAADAAKVVFDRSGRVTLGTVTYRIVVLRNPHATTDTSNGHTPGVFEQHPQVFRLGNQVATFESGTFRSGIPAGYLQVDQSMNSLTQAQADELKARWMAAHGGDRRSIAVLNSFTRFEPLNMSPVDAALGEVKRINVAEVAYSFGLEPEVLSTSLANSATYRNATEFWSRHRDFGLSPWIAAVQDTLSALLPGSQGVLVDLDRFANPAPKERFDGYKVAIDAGVLTANECRELEGLPPLPPPKLAPVLVPPVLEPVPDPDPEPDPGQQRARPAALRARSIP